jgi:hypothetical protein
MMLYTFTKHLVWHGGHLKAKAWYTVESWFPTFEAPLKRLPGFAHLGRESPPCGALA